LRNGTNSFDAELSERAQRTPLQRRDRDRSPRAGKVDRQCLKEGMRLRKFKRKAGKYREIPACRKQTICEATRYRRQRKTRQGHALDTKRFRDDPAEILVEGRKYPRLLHEIGELDLTAAQPGVVDPGGDDN